MAKLLTVSVSVYQMVLNKLGDLVTIPEQIRVEIKEVEGKIIVVPANLETCICFYGLRQPTWKIHSNAYVTEFGERIWFSSPLDYGSNIRPKQYLTITITDETV